MWTQVMHKKCLMENVKEDLCGKEEDIKIYTKVRMCHSVHWIKLAQNKVQLWASINMVTSHLDS